MTKKLLQSGLKDYQIYLIYFCSTKGIVLEDKTNYFGKK